MVEAEAGDMPLKKEAASPRQIGQVRLDFSHLSTHFEWNSWLHGRIRKVCLTSKSHMQTTHVVWSFSEPSPVYLYEGSISISDLFNPFGFTSPNLSAKLSRAS